MVDDKMIYNIIFQCLYYGNPAYFDQWTTLIGRRK